MLKLLAVHKPCDRVGQLQNRKTPKTRKLEKNWQKKTENPIFCQFVTFLFAYLSPFFLDFGAFL